MIGKIKIKYSLAAVPVIGVGMVYLSGVISQFMRNYEEWQQGGGVPGMGGSPMLPSLNFSDAMQSCFADGYGLTGLFICLGVCAILWFAVMRLGARENGVRDKERNLTFSKKGTYGTAAVLDRESLKGILNIERDASTTRETILGMLEEEVLCFPEDSFMNRNIAVCGPPGSRKSRSFTQNMILQCVRRGESLIVSDTKGEVYAKSCKYLEQAGYEVRVFNSDLPRQSDSWDLVGEVQGEELFAQIISDVMIQNTGTGSNPFWDNGEKNLLKALLLYVNGLPDSSMSKVYQSIIDSAGAGLINRILNLREGHPAKAPFEIFLTQDEGTRGKIINGLGTRLQVFQNQDVCGMTSYPEIDLSLPGVRKCAYFCISSDQHSAFDFLTTLFITFSFIRLVRLADAQPSQQLEVPVHILGEELCNFCRIPDLGKRLSSVRSRGISMSCVFQSIPQLQNRYPNDEWLEILSDCDTQVFLGCTDPVSAEYVSKRAGIASVMVNSESKALNTWRISDYTPQYRKTESVGKRQIFTPDEVMRLHPDEEIIVLRGQDVLKARKFDYSEHPDSKYLEICNAAEHNPAWRMKPLQPREGTKKRSKPARKENLGKIPFVEVDSQKSNSPEPGNIDAELKKHNVIKL